MTEWRQVKALRLQLLFGIYLLVQVFPTKPECLYFYFVKYLIGYCERFVNIRITFIIYKYDFTIILLSSSFILQYAFIQISVSLSQLFKFQRVKGWRRSSGKNKQTKKPQNKTKQKKTTAKKHTDSFLRLNSWFQPVKIFWCDKET